MQKNYFVYCKNDKKTEGYKTHVQHRSRTRKSKRLLTMPPRNRILFEQREGIIRAFEDVHEDYLMVADSIGVIKSTARSIVTRYVRKRRNAKRPRGGPNHVRVDNEMRDCLNDILNKNCLLTLAQINQDRAFRENLESMTVLWRGLLKFLKGVLNCSTIPSMSMKTINTQR